MLNPQQAQDYEDALHKAKMAVLAKVEDEAGDLSDYTAAASWAKAYALLVGSLRSD